MFYYLFILIYLIFFTFLAWRSLDWAVYLIVFALPGYLIRFSVLGLPITLLEGMMLVLFLVWLIKKTRKQENNNVKCQMSNALVYFIFLFILAATVSIFVSSHLRAAAGLWKAYFIEPILFLIVFIHAISKKKLKNVFIALSLSALVLSVLALYQKLTGDLIPNPFWAAEATRRVTGVFPYPNALALYLAPIATLSIGIIPIFKNYKIKNLLPLIYCLLLVAYCLSIYFTKSKGALLSLLAGLIFYAIFYKPYRKYFTAGLGIIIIFIFLYFYIFNIPLNLQGMSTVEGGGSLTTRLEMWNETWDMLKAKPILGTGLAGYQTAVAPFHGKNYIEIYLYPHNIFLNFWTEIGLLGLISFLFIIGWFYKIGFKQLTTNNLQLTTEYLKKSSVVSRQSSVILMAAMTCLLAHGLVDVPYFKNDLSVLFWILIGGMIILTKKFINQAGDNKQDEI